MIPASAKSLRTHNPIREIVDPIAASIANSSSNMSNNDKSSLETISLALGDPTMYLQPCPVAVQTILHTLQGTNLNSNLNKNTIAKTNTAGYVNACGTTEARLAIAHHHFQHDPNLHQHSYHQPCHNGVVPTLHPVLSELADHVIVANGCSGALELALTAVLDNDSILLVPQPGFPLYQVIAESHGATIAHYRLQSQCDWQIDWVHLRHWMEHQSNHKRVRAMIVNNPSNPTGAVFTKQHLQDIIHFAQFYHILLITDEIYGDITFIKERPFYPLAQIAFEMGQQVPIITASGIGKQYLVPGWRIGWIVFQDKYVMLIRE